MEITIRMPALQDQWNANNSVLRTRYRAPETLDGSATGKSDKSTFGWN